METSQDACIHNLMLFLNGVPEFYKLKYPENLYLPPSVHVSALKCTGEWEHEEPSHEGSSEQECP